MADFGMWAPYVPVATKLRNAAKAAEKVAKKAGRKPQPVTLTGRSIATTFWGRAWCDNLVNWKDYDNRLPRGVTYLRNGSVADLLSGKFSRGIMEQLTSTKTGLFPAAHDLKMSCSCPDSSSCCKHIAAVFYAIGVRLDHEPQLLFQLRGVDHLELVAHAVTAENLEKELTPTKSSDLQTDDLGELFGIELAADIGETPVVRESVKNLAPQQTAPAKPAPGKKKAPTAKITASKKAAATKNTAPTKKTAAAEMATATKRKAAAKKNSAVKSTARPGKDNPAATATRTDMQALRDALTDVSISDIQSRKSKTKRR